MKDQEAEMIGTDTEIYHGVARCRFVPNSTNIVKC